MKDYRDLYTVIFTRVDGSRGERIVLASSEAYAIAAVEAQALDFQERMNSTAFQGHAIARIHGVFVTTPIEGE